MDDAQLYISFLTDVRFVRMIDESISPIWIKLSADIFPNEDATVDDINDAFMRIRTWIDSILSVSVAFSSTNQTATRMFVHANGMPVTGNTVMITPGEPTDETLCALFHAKFNALGDGAIEFINVKVESESEFRLSFCFEGNAAEVLPPHEEWLSNDTYFDVPWWNRNDGTTHDFPCEDSMKGIEPLWAIAFIIPETLSPIPENPDKPKAKVQFTPIVLKGGKRKT